MKKQPVTKKEFQFTSLKDGQGVKGLFVGFGKNRFGVFIKLDTEKKIEAINLKNSVLKNIIKNNLDLLEENQTEILIERIGKPKNKNYVIYEVYLNGEKLSSSTYELDKERVKDLLDD